MTDNSPVIIPIWQLCSKLAGRAAKWEGLDCWSAAALFVLTVISRLPFRSTTAYLLDSQNFCIAALTNLVAPHPPGYIGYCLLGRAGYFITHDINQSFVFISIFAIAATSASIYLFGAQAFGRARALAAAILFATSLDSLFYSEVALSYPVEALVATLFAWFAWRAISLKSAGDLLLSTLILGIGTSVRSTGLFFLCPLWLFTTFRSTRSLQMRLANLMLLTVLVLTWSIPLVERMSSRQPGGYTGLLYEHQGARILDYDRASLPGEQTGFEPAKRFMWPGVELVVASWNQVVKPSPDAAPEVLNASLGHALALLRTQILKLGFYTLLACGLCVFFWIFPLISRNVKAKVRPRAAFFLLWILPAALFFALGHFGPWGFLLIYLPALCLISADFLFSFFEATKLPQSQQLLICSGLCAVSTMASVSFFALCKPIPETSTRAKLMNLVLFQYTGPAILEQFARARHPIPVPQDIDKIDSKLLQETRNGQPR